MAITNSTSPAPSVIYVPGVGTPGRNGRDGVDGTDGTNGRDGAPGLGTVITRMAAVSVGAWRAVIVDDDGNARPADPSNPSHRGKVIGVTARGAMVGLQVSIQNAGDLTGPTGGFTPGAPLFVGAGGALVTTPPASGWRQVVATAVASGQIVVALGEARVVSDEGTALVIPDGGFSSPASDAEAKAQQTDAKYLTPARLPVVLDPIRTLAQIPDSSRLAAYGWRGDNSNLKLSDVYSTLAAAKAVFPSAVSLSEYLDGCAIERVLQVKSQYFGRASIQIPHGGSRVSRTIDTTGFEVYIRGCGQGPTQIIAYTAGMTLFKHGLGEVPYVEGQAQQRPFRMENIRLDCEVAPAGTRALDISYNETTGVWFQTILKNVDVRGFERPIRVRNPCRGLQLDTVGVFGPDGTIQNYPAIEIITDENSRDFSAQACFKSVRTANYRWGWDVLMKLGSGATQAERDANRRSMEGFVFVDCGSYNGWGMVRCVNEYTNYWSLLWEFNGCDWQGGANAFHMVGCSHVLINGGFWIGNPGGPPGDAANPIDTRDPLTNLPERRYFTFERCLDVHMTKPAISVQSGYGPHCLVHSDVACVNVSIEKAIVRDYDTSANAGFRLQGRDTYYTARELYTFWDAWSSDPSKRVVDPAFCQLSTTNARPYGSVDGYGEYQFRGVYEGNTDGAGNITVPLPVRATGGHPFFIMGDGSPFITFSTRAVSTTPPPARLGANDAYSFVVEFGSSFANQAVKISWRASGR